MARLFSTAPIWINHPPTRNIVSISCGKRAIFNFFSLPHKDCAPRPEVIAVLIAFPVEIKKYITTVSVIVNIKIMNNANRVWLAPNTEWPKNPLVPTTIKLIRFINMRE